MRGDAHLSATRRFWRTVIVASLSAFVLGATQPNILAAISGISEGTFGVTLDYIGVVTRVTPGLPAARAGISPGDQIEPVSFGDRMTAFESPISVPGTPMRAVVKHGDSARTLTLTSVAIGQNATVLITVIKRLTALAFTTAGDYIRVVIRNPYADPSVYRAEFAAHHLDISLLMVPGSPSVVGLSKGPGSPLPQYMYIRVQRRFSARVAGSWAAQLMPSLA